MSRPGPLLSKILLGLAALLAALVLALGTAAWWLGHTEEGLGWALERATRAAGGKLVLEGAQGALAREVRLERAAWTDEGVRIVVRGVRTRLDLLALLAATIELDYLHADTVEVAITPKGGPPPQRLGLPFPLRIAEVEVKSLVVDEQTRRHTVSQLRFAYTGGPAGHQIQNLHAETPWGRVGLQGSMQGAPPFEMAATGSLERREGKASGRARLHPFAERKIDQLELTAQGVDLAAFDERFPKTSLGVRLEGAGTADALLAGTLSASNALAGPLDGQRLPASTLSARFSLQGESAMIEGLEAQAAGGSIRGRGSVQGKNAQFELQLAQIDLRALRSTLRKTHLAGTLRLELRPDQQAVQASLAQDRMRLKADALRRGDDIDVRSLHVEANGGIAQGSGHVRLGEPIGAEGKLQFSRFDPSQFGEYPEGSISGSAVVSGRLGKVRQLEARWDVADSTLAGKTLASRGSGSLDGERLHRLDAVVRWGANALTAKGGLGAADERIDWTVQAPELPFQGLEGKIQAAGRVSGSWKAPQFSFTAKASPAVIAGRLRMKTLGATGEGTLARHSVSLEATGEGFEATARLRGGWSKSAGWEGELVDLRNAGRYPLQLAANVPLRLAPQQVHAGTLRARLGQGELLVRTVDWKPGRLSTSGEFTGLPAAWLIVPAGLGDTLRSTLLVDGAWSIDSTPQLNGQVSLKRASGDLVIATPAALDMGLRSASLVARFDEGRVSANVAIASQLGTLEAQGTAAGFTKDSALRFSAKLDVADIRALTGPLPAHVRLAGRAAATIEGRGTLGKPELAGNARADALSVHYPPYGVYLDDGLLRATLEGDALRIEELTLRGGEGRFSASGLLPLKKDRPASLRWSAASLRLLNRPDMRLVVSGDGVAGIENRRVALQGKLRADSGRLERGFRRLPKLDDDIVIVGTPQETPETRAPIPLDLDLLVDLGERFEVHEAGFDGFLKGQVHVSSAAGGDLRAIGRIEATRATFRAYGQSLTVDPGILIFNGPIRNPTLQVTAWRRNQPVEVGVRITGNLEQPQVELISEPPVPDGTKLSWLVLGRAPGDAAGADLALLQTAAGALLGRGESVPITTRIAKAVGLDELTLRGSSELASRVVALGKRLSDRVYVSYERGLGATVENLVKLDLSLTDRISLRAQTGTTSGVGVYYRYSWD